jgi:hypothetical protein
MAQISVDFTGTDVPQEVQDIITSAVAQISAALEARTPDDTARSRILMQSPNGNVWTLYVDDSGFVSALGLASPYSAAGREGRSRAKRSW